MFEVLVIVAGTLVAFTVLGVLAKVFAQRILTFINE